MQDYYEQLWERLPDELHPPDLPRRRAFCLDGVRPGLRVLDLGCGEGEITAALAAAGARVTGVDVARAALERAHRRHPQLDDLRRAELEGPLPLRDGEVARVVASEVIEHVADTEGWLREIRRVLEPGGQLRVTTPDHGRLRLLVGGVERYSPPLGDHLHLYSARSLRDVLGQLGFGQISVRRAGGAPGWRRRLLASALRD